MAWRRLLPHGTGALVALGYWTVVALMLVVGAVLLVAFVGPALTLFWFVLCVCAYGFGLFLCFVAALLTIAEATRRPAVAFLVASGAANVGLIALVALLAATVNALASIMNA